MVVQLKDTPKKTPPVDIINPYFLDSWAPITEERTVYNLPFEGAIPKQLTGRYLRNGPNPTAVPHGPFQWLNGDGMVHGVELRDGRATWYRNRFVRTNRVAEALPVPPPTGPPDVNPFNPANTHVVAHAGRILALCEAGLPYELTTELDTVGRYNFCGRLASPMNAHPKVDPFTGELHFLGYSPVKPFLRYHLVDKAGALVRSEAIEVKGPTMMHDFAITENYVIFYDLPVVVDASLLADPEMFFRWDRGYGARLGVMPRTGSANVRWFEIDPCFVYHTVNAYEEGSTVVVDVARYPEAFNRDRPGSLMSFAIDPTTFEQFRIDLATGEVTETRLDDRPFELPRVDDRHVGRPYRYGYGVELNRGQNGRALEFGNPLKYDRKRGTTEVHNFGPGAMAGEGIFVQAGPDAAEDEGWTLAYVWNEGRSDLVILNAGDFSGEPAATIHLPWRVPPGLHGSWIPDSILG